MILEMKHREINYFSGNKSNKYLSTLLTFIHLLIYEYLDYKVVSIISDTF